ncbi:hypothetical protein GGX14DRAFT_560970 [Mycena pura]|uniref:Uncharacterized protein n=1 Tax=Mycena pura TaxID=153505 RepID=A0AAD6VNZ7_9AGAR|nr:hypothetical protein GGX14DRAFT_560970 [Mycena pura]
MILPSQTLARPHAVVLPDLRGRKTSLKIPAADAYAPLSGLTLVRAGGAVVEPAPKLAELIICPKSSPEKENSRGRGRRGSKQQPQLSRSPRPALRNLNDNAPAGNTSPPDVEALQKRIEELEAQVTQLPAAAKAPSVPDESIARPRAASKVPMKEIQRHLGYDDKQWNSLFRTYCRDALTSARLKTGENWKAQRAEKLTMAYNAIEEAFPETRRFQGQWGIDRTVKQCWDNRMNYYRNNVDKPDTYRGREAAARRARRNGSSPPRSSHSPPPSDRDRAPSPGPSRPQPRPKKNPARVESGSEDEDNDQFVAQSQDEDDDDENEDSAGVGMSARALGKRKADVQGGREHRLFSALRPLYDGIKKKWFIVGAIGEPIEVPDIDALHATLDRLEKNPPTMATKLRLWTLQIPLPRVPPLVLAIQPIEAKVKGLQLGEWQLRLMKGLISREFRIIASGGDGASVERDCQRRVAAASKPVEFRIKHPDPDSPDIVVELWELDGNVWVIFQDAKHARKTFRNNAASGARGLILGNYA